MGNLWIQIVQWFQDRNDRKELILGFNKAAREAFVVGVVPIVLEASISRGEPRYHHQYSRWLSSGFRIKAFTGRQLNKDDIKNIGLAVLSDEVLIRRMVVLGWDTLEVHCDIGNYGLRWQLCDHMVLGSGNN